MTNIVLTAIARFPLNLVESVLLKIPPPMTQVSYGFFSLNYCGLFICTGGHDNILPLLCTNAFH